MRYIKKKVNFLGVAFDAFCASHEFGYAGFGFDVKGVYTFNFVVAEFTFWQEVSL